MDYKSIELVTRNENGDREVVFELRRTVFDWLLRRNAKVLRFVQPQHAKTVWHYKGSGRRAGTKWDSACCEVVEFARQISASVA